MALDTTQYAAVRHFTGPAMILAGPGSGKTTVITHRVWSLIKDRHVDESKILVITFTKMAATEMKNRFLKLGGLRTTKVNFGTFHAIFFAILRDAYGFKATDIVKTSQQWRFIKTQFSLYNVEIRDENNTIADIISEIGKLKGMDEAARHDYMPRSCESRLFRNIFNEYQMWLSSSHMVDFEDMMIKTYELLKGDKEQLARWQERFEYIMVDEFQDSSPIQFEIVQLLAENHRNTFIVGDDDQSLYGFRGAAPAVMQDFKTVYPDTKVYELSINYRSNACVVEAATRLINHNKDRFYKDLKAFHDRAEDVERHVFETMHDENVYIAGMLHDDVQTAILTRTNSAAADIKRFLEHEGIMPDMKAGKSTDKLFAHWIALDMASYVRLATGGRMRSDYARIINKPVRYISRQFFTEEDVDTAFIIRRMKQGGQLQLSERFEKMLAQLHTIAVMTPFAGINYIRKAVGYDSYIISYAKEHGGDASAFMNILDRLQESARDCRTYEMWLELFDTVTDSGKQGDSSVGSSGTTAHKNAVNGEAVDSNGKSENSGSTSDKKTDSSKKGGNVIICTMHSSKGLEYDRVIIIDANEGITPYNKAVSAQDIEEERRLFYVAMTRAKKQLIICSVNERYNKPLLPSRFLGEF